MNPRFLASVLVAAGLAARLPAVERIIPYYKHSQTLVASSGLDGKTYLMVPFLLPVDASTLLVGYKRGYAHLTDREADIEVLRLNPRTERIIDRSTLRHPGRNFQNAEFARFANGEIACYIDVQAPGPAGTASAGAATDVKVTRTARTGLVEFRSADGGRTWQDRGRLGPVDGVEYGYAFEALTEGATTWMLVMTFANLPGGKSFYPPRPYAGSVDVIRTTDNGRTWRRVRNLTAELGNAPINESSLARSGDGFVVAARGYDNRQWLCLTDREFRLQRKADLTATHDFIRSYVGRPRILVRDGRYYVVGRNWDKEPLDRGSILGPQATTRRPDATPMKLSLFRFDPATLAVDRHVILDNAEEENVIDGYYAAPYWQEREGRTYFNAIIYKRVLGRNPDLVRLEFDWEEIR
jgi:hypothetical protein